VTLTPPRVQGCRHPSGCRLSLGLAGLLAACAAPQGGEAALRVERVEGYVWPAAAPSGAEVFALVTALVVARPAGGALGPGDAAASLAAARDWCRARGADLAAQAPARLHAGRWAFPACDRDPGG